MDKFIVVLLVLGMATTACAAGPVANPPTTDIGKEIVAISSHLQMMAGDFTKSQIGQMTYFALAWKFIYKPIILMVACFLFWIIGNIIILVQWRKKWPRCIEEGTVSDAHFLLVLMTIGINVVGILMLFNV